jgi:hypothetical protein
MEMRFLHSATCDDAREISIALQITARLQGRSVINDELPDAISVRSG